MLKDEGEKKEYWAMEHKETLDKLPGISVCASYIIDLEQKNDYFQGPVNSNQRSLQKPVLCVYPNE